MPESLMPLDAPLNELGKALLGGLLALGKGMGRLAGRRVVHLAAGSDAHLPASTNTRLAAIEDARAAGGSYHGSRL